MTDFIERFRKRLIVSPTVELPFEGVTLTVRRFSQDEINVAGQKARSYLREEGLDPDSVNDNERGFALAYALTDIIKRHVASWTFSPGIEPIPFSQQNVNEMFSILSKPERVMLGLTYLARARDPEKKTETSTPLSQSSNSD